LTQDICSAEVLYLEQRRGVLVGLLRQLVLAADDDALLEQVADAGDDLG
jgi:hypothetical protein